MTANTLPGEFVNTQPYPHLTGSGVTHRTWTISALYDGTGIRGGEVTLTNNGVPVLSFKHPQPHMALIALHRTLCHAAGDFTEVES